MARVGFYHMEQDGWEAVLPALLEKTLKSGMRAVVWMDSEERVESVNRMLWTYRPESFLPHGSARDGFPERQPVFLTAREENPNQAQVLVLAGFYETDKIKDFQRVMVMVDGRDRESVEKSRTLWKACQEGHERAYFRKTADGWEKKA